MSITSRRLVLGWPIVVLLSERLPVTVAADQPNGAGAKLSATGRKAKARTNLHDVAGLTAAPICGAYWVEIIGQDPSASRGWQARTSELGRT
jgi:hypothetical protein